jgi:hypothetical protein
MTKVLQRKVKQDILVTGASTECPALPACGRQVGGDGGNGLQNWSQSRQYYKITLTRKPRPVGGELHLKIGSLEFVWRLGFGDWCLS